MGLSNKAPNFGAPVLKSQLGSKRKAPYFCKLYMGDCQNYGPLLGPYYNTGPNTGPDLGDPKRDHNFDSPPYYVALLGLSLGFGALQCLWLWGFRDSGLTAVGLGQVKT